MRASAIVSSVMEMDSVAKTIQPAAETNVNTSTATSPDNEVSAVVSAVSLRQPVERPDSTWEHVGPMNVLNFIGSNVPKLGKDHPICPDIKVDDGKLVVVWMAGGHSRTECASAGMSMKAGKYLAHHKQMTARVAKEFMCFPYTFDPSLSKKQQEECLARGPVPFNIDGDPVTPAAMHALILNRAIRIHCMSGTETRPGTICSISLIDSHEFCLFLSL